LTRDRAAVSLAELSFLVSMGATTGLVRCLVDLRLGLPGHSIVLIVLPLALGIALAPRRGAGTVMGLSAAATALTFKCAGIGHAVGPGAFTSLAVTGVAFDVWMARLRGKKSVYASWILAAFSANFLAFVVRAGMKLSGAWPGVGVGAFRPGWLARAAVSYSACGIVAGFVCAWICFKFRREDDDRFAGTMACVRTRTDTD